MLVKIKILVSLSARSYVNFGKFLSIIFFIPKKIRLDFLLFFIDKNKIRCVWYMDYCCWKENDTKSIHFALFQLLDCNFIFKCQTKPVKIVCNRKVYYIHYKFHWGIHISTNISIKIVCLFWNVINAKTNLNKKVNIKTNE